MGEGHFQNEWRAIVLYYAPQFENVPAFGLYSTLLSLDLGSTKILFFPIFFSFFPLSLGVTYNTFFFFFWGWVLMTTTPWAFPRSHVCVTHCRKEAKKNSIRNGWPYPLIFGYLVASPSCSHHWFQCRSPTLSLLFHFACKLQLLFRFAIAKRKYTHFRDKKKGFKKITSHFMFKIYFPLEIIMFVWRRNSKLHS